MNPLTVYPGAGAGGAGMIAMIMVTLVAERRRATVFCKTLALIFRRRSFLGVSSPTSPTGTLCRRAFGVPDRAPNQSLIPTSMEALMLEELEAPARRKTACLDDIPARRSARSFADLQQAARHFDAKRYEYLAEAFERAGMKDKAALARRWSREHIMVAAQLRRIGTP